MTLQTMSRKIATNIVTTKAYDTEKRWIWTNTDLTERDKEEIQRIKKEVQHILRTMKDWDDVMDALHEIGTKSFHIGFKEQDRIIAVCEQSGIRFK